MTTCAALDCTNEAIYTTLTDDCLCEHHKEQLMNYQVVKLRDGAIYLKKGQFLQLIEGGKNKAGG